MPMFHGLTRAAAVVCCAGAVAIPLSANGQVFQRSFGDPREEVILDIERTSDAGWISVGFRASPAGDEDILITKHFPDGTIEWQREWAGPGRDVAYSVLESDAGGFVVGAESTTNPDPAFQQLLIRLDPAGGLIWNFFYPGTFQADPVHAPPPGVHIDESPEGDIFFVGSFLGTPTLARADAGGGLIYSRAYFGGTAADILRGFTDIRFDGTTGGPPGLGESVVVSGSRLFLGMDPLTGALTEFLDPFLARLRAADGAVALYRPYDYSISDRNPDNGFNVRSTGEGLDIREDGAVILHGRTDFGIPPAGVPPLDGTHLLLTGPGLFPAWSSQYEAFDLSGVKVPLETAYSSVHFDERDPGRIVTGGTGLFPEAPNAYMRLTDAGGGAPLGAMRYGLDVPTFGLAVDADRECGYTVGGGELLAAGVDNLHVKSDDALASGCREADFIVEPDGRAEVLDDELFIEPLGDFLPAPDLLRDADSGEREYCFDTDCGAPPCKADVNGDGSVTFADVTAFIAAFNGGLPAADIDMNGMVNFADVTAFIAAFNAGCP